MKIILFLLIGLALMQSITITVQRYGNGCTICAGNNGTTGNYACSNNYGIWNNGFNSFNATIPNGNIVTSITASTHGQFGCQGSADLSLILNGNLVKRGIYNGKCTCGICDPAVIFTNNTIPLYNYDSTNIIQIVVNSGLICVHDMDITLNYGLGNRQGTIPPPICSNGCGNGICVYNQYQQSVCSCPFAWFGTQCQYNIVPSLTGTDSPPVLDLPNTGFKTKGIFTVTVKNSIKYYNTLIDFVRSTNDTCNYSEPYKGIIWTNTELNGEPTIAYTMTIPWDDFYPSCIFNREVVGNYLVFGGVMQITNNEFLGNLSSLRPIPIVRTVSTSIVILVQYPIAINLQSGNINVFSSILIQAAIISQVWNSGFPSIPGSGIIILETTVQNPFLLNATQITGPYGMTLSVSLYDNSGCPDDGRSICIQQWQIINVPDNNLCVIDGSYMSNFTVTCQQSRQNNCPIDSNTNSGAVQFDLVSGNFCPQITDTVDLTGTLTTYLDKDMTIPKSDYLFGQVVYIKIRLDSTKAKIIQATLNTLSVTLWNGIVAQIYSNGITSTGTILNTQVDITSNPQENYINLVVNKNIFNVDQDSNQPIVFNAQVTATFENTGPVLMNIEKIFQNTNEKSLTTTSYASITGTTVVNSSYKNILSSCFIALILIILL